MTKTEIEKLIEDGKIVGLRVRDNGDGSVTYGNTRTCDASRAAYDIFSQRGA